MSNWRFFERLSEKELEGSFSAHWEVSLDPISDDYTPSEIRAENLFRKWVKKVNAKYPNDLIPILWFVQVRGEKCSLYENMPFQVDSLSGVTSRNFLTTYTQPLHPTTNEPMNWLTLPVKDKLWNSKHNNKGGFIQQATGWKPSILQPYVYLSALTSVMKTI